MKYFWQYKHAALQAIWTPRPYISYQLECSKNVFLYLDATLAYLKKPCFGEMSLKVLPKKKKNKS